MIHKPVYKYKVWGLEALIVNREYCGKILELDEGFRCSFHLHKIKKEDFCVLSGLIALKVKDELYFLKPDDIKIGRAHV